MEKFCRRQDSDRWHWSRSCSNYPTENDVMKCRAKEPEYGILCEECEEKEPITESPQENKFGAEGQVGDL